MALKPDQERVKTLLRDTITLLCKNGLEFQNKFSLEALIGVTVDEGDVFLLSINELIKSDRYVEYVPTQGKSPGSPAQKRRKRARRSSEDVKKQSPDAAPPKIAREISDDDVDNVESDQGDPDLVYVKQEAVEDPGDWNVVQTVAGSSGTSYTQPVTVSSVPQVHDETFEAVGDLLSAQDMQDGDWVEQGEGTSGQQQFNTSTATITLPGQGEEGGEQPQQQTLHFPRVADKKGKVDVQYDESTKIRKRLCQYEGCNFATYHRSTMSRHQRAHRKVYNECPKCGKKFVEKYDLNVHIATVHENQSLMCEHCGKVFSTRTGLNFHERKHKDPDTNHEFSCEFCGKGYTRIHNFKNHMETHSEYMENENMKKDLEELVAKKRNSVILKKDKELKMRYCLVEGCTYSSRYRSSMIRHQKRGHSNSYMKCPFCERRFIENYDLRKHIESAHEDKQLLSYDECGTASETKESMNIHQESECPVNIIINVKSEDADMSTQEIHTDVALAEEAHEDNQLLSYDKCGTATEPKESMIIHQESERPVNIIINVKSEDVDMSTREIHTDVALSEEGTLISDENISMEILDYSK